VRRTALEQLLFLFLFVGCGLLSIISLSLGSDRFAYQDVLTLARGPVYGLILAVASSVVINEPQMRSFVTLLMLMGVAPTGVSLIHYYNVVGLNATFRPLYLEDAGGRSEPDRWLASLPEEADLSAVRTALIERIRRPGGGGNA